MAINSPPTSPELSTRADAVRRFNRFYTRRIGALQEHLLESGFSLTEARVLYELVHRPGLSGADLCRELGLNAGYLSRVLSGFEQRGLLAKRRSSADARAAELYLTEAGYAAFAPLEAASRGEVEALLRTLPEADQQQLVEAMARIEGLLGEPDRNYLLRDPRPGDLGWIVHRQALLYAQEYGFDDEYEALVAEIVASYVRAFDPKRHRCWIAERLGQVVGSVFVVPQDERTARLRLLYVDARARGLGIGGRLVDECLRFARLAGYGRMTLWTNSVLTEARRLYERAGFQLVDEAPHHSFGQDLVGQTWAREL